MGKLLCVYYSRTGNTKAVVDKIADALGNETVDIVELSDNRKRAGMLGYLRCGMDAMSKHTDPLNTVVIPKKFSKYDRIIIATPVWAGRCSSLVRTFLRIHGSKIYEPTYVLTHMAEKDYAEVCTQMDGYTASNHGDMLSLVPGSADYEIKLNAFLKKLKPQE